MIIAVDPGSAFSAWVMLESGRPVRHGKQRNEEVIESVRRHWEIERTVLAVEGIQSFGMAVGKEVFDTCYFIGRLMEAWEFRGGTTRLIYRRDVKLYHCDSARANDSNIRAALIDRFGPGKDRAIGIKSAPGPLYGIKADEWSALAVALTAEGALQIAPPVVARAPAMIDDPSIPFGATA